MRREMQGESINRIIGAFMNHMIQVLKLSYLGKEQKDITSRSRLI